MNSNDKLLFEAEDDSDDDIALPSMISERRDGQGVGDLPRHSGSMSRRAGNPSRPGSAAAEWPIAATEGPPGAATGRRPRR